METVRRHEYNIPGLKNSKWYLPCCHNNQKYSKFSKKWYKKSIFHFFLVKTVSMKLGVIYICMLLVKMKQNLFKILNIFQDIGFLIFD